MASALDKISTLFRTKLHNILDRAIGSDPGAVKVYIRDLEDAIRDTNIAAAQAKAELIIAKQDIAGINAVIKKTNEQADLLLGDSDSSNDHFVGDTLEPKLIKLEAEVKEKTETLDGLQKAADALSQVVGKMTAKCSEMKGQLSTLEAKARAAAAKNKAADAIEAAGSISNSVDASASVDSIAARIRREDEVASQRLDQATSGMAGGDGAAMAIADSEAAARVAARRARLAAAKSGTSA